MTGFFAGLSFDNQLRVFFVLAGVWVGLVCLGMAPSTHGQDQS